MRFAKQKDIFSGGYLKTLADNVFSQTLDSKELLTADDLHRIPEIYAKIDYNPESEGCILDYIESDKVYQTGNGKVISGTDIKAITSLMYLFARTKYSKCPLRSGVTGAVPLVMLGFKRWQGINYQDWYTGKEDIEHVYSRDLLLGSTLASTMYNADNDEIVFRKGFGLVLLAAYENRPNYGDVKMMRAGNVYKNQSYAAGHGAKKVTGVKGNGVIDLHNACTNAMRLLLSQRWAYYGNHREDGAILDFQDWDNIPKSVDDLSVAIKGEEPKITRSNLMNTRFGIG